MSWGPKKPAGCQNCQKGLFSFKMSNTVCYKIRQYGFFSYYKQDKCAAVLSWINGVRLSHGELAVKLRRFNVKKIVHKTFLSQVPVPH
jgi:hypothetical protein